MAKVPVGNSIASARVPATILRHLRKVSTKPETGFSLSVISSSCRYKANPSDREQAEGEHEPMHYSRPALAQSGLNACAHLGLLRCYLSFLVEVGVRPGGRRS